MAEVQVAPVDVTPPPLRIGDAGEVGIEFWRRADLVETYDRRDLRPIERELLDRHRAALSGAVLELGTGAGRVTRHLCAMAAELHGIDISGPMVRRAQAACPAATIVVRDLRETGVYGADRFDAVFGSYNVLDVLDHDDRERVLAAIWKVLKPGGLLIFSSHNRGAIGRVHGPVSQLLDDVEHLRLKRSVAGLLRLRRRMANRARMRSFERSTADYAVVNDNAHDYALAQYYIERDEQERQLARHGFALEAAYDLGGALIPAGSSAQTVTEVTYVATKVDRPSTLTDSAVLTTA